MKKGLLYIALSIIVIYGLLLIPDNSSINIESEGNSTPFIWNQDARWDDLETRFTEARMNADLVSPGTMDVLISEFNISLDDLEESDFDPDDIRLDALLNDFFEIAPLIAAQKNQNKDFFELYNRTRRIIKEESVNWDINQLETRVALYKVLYGMRATVEEVLLQSNEEIEPVLYVKEEQSATPSTYLLGIKVHSGDLLVSRGGAEVSALISRGNDFPGNFSHVALIYVEKGTNIPYLIEAHIERGVAIASAQEYVNDRKLRFMVLRPRADLPEMVANPMLPHFAAKEAYEEVQRRHIPYDFKMNFFDQEAMFCSEVGSYTYKNNGIQLWQSESTISSYGVVTLLNTFGVENFVTQMPSDLEYDPQLSVVAEWRNSEALYDDHLYNAVIDAMLECADKREEIEYNHFLLPVIRVLKGYSVIKNQFGGVGPIPEGMNSTQALKSDAFIGRHEEIKMATDEKVTEFKQNKGYLPPYWEMVKLARESADGTKNKNEKKVHLVLGSGGARGLAHISVIESLEEEGHEIIEIIGCSMGAVIGGFYASGHLKEYKEWLFGLSKSDVFDLMDFTFTKQGFIKGEKIFSRLKEMTGDLKIEDFNIPFTAVATDIKNNKEVHFKKGDLFKALRATVSIPGVFIPVIQGNKLLVDGGVLNPMPVNLVKKQEGAIVVAVNLNAPAEEAFKVSKRSTKELARKNEIQKWIEKVLPDGLKEYAKKYEKETKIEKEEFSLMGLMEATFSFTQDRLTTLILETYKPDVLISIPRNAAGTFEFYESKKIYELGIKRYKEAMKALNE